MQNKDIINLARLQGIDEKFYVKSVECPDNKTKEGKEIRKYLKLLKTIFLTDINGKIT